MKFSHFLKKADNSCSMRPSFTFDLQFCIYNSIKMILGNLHN